MIIDKDRERLRNYWYGELANEAVLGPFIRFAIDVPECDRFGGGEGRPAAPVYEHSVA